MKRRLDALLKKLKEPGSTDWKRGSSRPKMARMFAPELANTWNMTVSEGSATIPLRCGGICNDRFVANFLLSLAVKEFWKSINIWWSYRHKYGCPFLTHTVYKRNLLLERSVSIFLLYSYAYVPPRTCPRKILATPMPPTLPTLFTDFRISTRVTAATS